MCPAPNCGAGTPDGGWLLDDRELKTFVPTKKKKEKKKIKKPKEQGRKKS